MKTGSWFTVPLVAGLLGPAGALAHHSTFAEYDREQTIQFVGTLAKLDFANPHVWFHFYETLPDGMIKEWTLQWGSPGQIRRAIVGQYGTLEFELGETYKLKAAPARADAAGGYLKAVLFPDGSELTCC